MKSKFKYLKFYLKEKFYLKSNVGLQKSAGILNFEKSRISNHRKVITLGRLSPVCRFEKVHYYETFESCRENMAKI